MTTTATVSSDSDGSHTLKACPTVPATAAYAIEGLRLQHPPYLGDFLYLLDDTKRRNYAHLEISKPPSDEL